MSGTVKLSSTTSLVLLALTMLSAVASGQAGERGEAFRGTYTNGDYGFYVTLPDGMAGYMAPQPAIDHGFFIELSKTDQAGAWVHATTPPGEKTLDEVIADQLYYFGSEKKARVVSKKPARLTLEIPVEDKTRPPTLGEIVKTRLSSVEAVRVLIEYTEPRRREIVVQDLVLALFKQREDFTVVYFIGLQAPKSKHAKYAHIVDDLQKRFTILKMYP